MIDGFWLLQFEGTQGNGGGVVVFINGKLFGGDSQTTYTDDYQEIGNKVTARAFIHNYMPGVASVIGIEGDYLLEVEGTIRGAVIIATGRPVGHNAVGMAIRLTKLEDLPE